MMKMIKMIFVPGDMPQEVSEITVFAGYCRVVDQTNDGPDRSRKPLLIHSLPIKPSAPQLSCGTSGHCGVVFSLCLVGQELMGRVY